MQLLKTIKYCVLHAQFANFFSENLISRICIKYVKSEKNENTI